MPMKIKLRINILKEKHDMKSVLHVTFHVTTMVENLTCKYTTNKTLDNFLQINFAQN